MPGVNRVTLLGRVGRDPELKYTPSGAAVVNFSLATSETWNDKNTGQRVEKTEWHRCVAWNRLAEVINQYCGKGKMVYIEGKIETRQWEDQNGAKRYTTEIKASHIQLLGGGNGQPAAQNRPQAQYQQPQPGAAQPQGQYHQPPQRPQQPPQQLQNQHQPYEAPPPPEDDIPF